MQSIKYDKENQPILNHTYDIPVKFQIHDKQIILCEVRACIENKGNKAAKQAIDIPGLPYKNNT